MRGVVDYSAEGKIKVTGVACVRWRDRWSVEEKILLAIREYSGEEGSQETSQLPAGIGR